MSWSATIIDPLGITVEHPLKHFHEEWSRDNIAYPFDADLALDLARLLMLKGVTISGGRTPIIGGEGEEEVVVVTITGSTKTKHFLDLMQSTIRQGPGADTPVALHYKALAILREHPCRHEFEEKKCLLCGVHYEGGLFSFE